MFLHVCAQNIYTITDKQIANNKSDGKEPTLRSLNEKKKAKSKPKALTTSMDTWIVLIISL